ncbi:poly-beta-1,6-N-acetyl-D-glucosamine synthase [Aeromonas enteropelogenes]|uniref:poly-beta-1,6-N-acetyl-D-glucosamine synthase n=1 Tax=Aeromonas enteropelogenes TaxID=29489 RepID=UPI001CCD47C2|nr:poly-beta-1,6-N-acetyl-D-glucosamine synthase [Aeromonas enteropelogenes]UBH28596.1 poly-beta-1,6 N-acetyl-D-glucosamine synthase [Aeromonas enteropelogenes]
MNELLHGIVMFTLAYPSVMAMVWICGGLYYYVQWERRDIAQAKAGLVLPRYPKVTLMVPCYNEGDNVEETISHLLRQRYPDFEVLAINDGSKDDTGERLDRLAAQDRRITVLHQPNQGKAMALNNGLALARGEILVGIDGDAVLDYDAVAWMVKNFIESPRVGAVTGNPRVRTRSTIIGKIQTGEFSAIIGLIKRAQRIYGRVFTVSGVVSAFRKSAVEEVGGWSTDMVTEDIDISWRLQLAGWRIHYQPQALCWVLMPETLGGLYKQRLRWAQGGAEVFLRYGLQALHWRNHRFWVLLLDYLFSVFWCYSMLFLSLIWVIEPDLSGLTNGHLFEWTGVVMTVMCLLQFSVSIFIDSHYDKTMIRSFLWCVWYPLIYWLLNLVTVVVAVPKAILRRRGRLAVWESPDRGESFRDRT